jgi:thiosulfate/3-mercaptopyruvate sulfurtransferase
VSASTPLLMTPEALVERHDDPSLRLIDTRYYLDGRDPRSAFATGHIAGAVYTDVERDLTGHPGTGGGRHPLPTTAEFERAARRVGISMDSHVVVYSNAFAAARLWWLLRYFGFDRVSLLDGGLDGWGGAIEQGEAPAVPPGDFVVRGERSEWLAGFDELRGDPDQLLLDARGPDRFRGEVAPGDPYPGRIPGARSAHWEAVGLTEDGRFADPESLRARLETLGVTDDAPAICYCGSGVQACHLIFSMALAEVGAPRLYVGSWSEYSRRTPSFRATRLV